MNLNELKSYNLQLTPTLTVDIRPVVSMDVAVFSHYFQGSLNSMCREF
jgi:hypothetical protein